MVDWMTGEACHRGMLKIKKYTAADNKYYKALWQDWRNHITPALGEKKNVSYAELANPFGS